MCDHDQPCGGHWTRSLFQAAFAATGCKADLSSRIFYDRQRARGKTHTQAILRLARQRVNVIHAMIRTGALNDVRTPGDVDLAAYAALAPATRSSTPLAAAWAKTSARVRSRSSDAPGTANPRAASRGRISWTARVIVERSTL
jgi:hypothetical protein